MNDNACITGLTKECITTICFCCLHEGSTKNSNIEYSSSGKTEVHKQMLKETFNIEISKPLDGVDYLICDECFLRLHDAYKFKSCVLQNQQIFTKHYGHHLEGYSAECEFKVETDKSDNMEKFSPQRKRKLNHHRNYFHDEDYECSKAYSTTLDYLRLTERRGQAPLLRSNSLKLLANSTICVFQWYKSRYRCFCCKEPFSDIDVLREHTNKEHTLKTIESKIILTQNPLVKVEISLLYCKICNATLDSLEALLVHLCEAHKIQFTSREHLLVPFKIQKGNLQCQICSEKFILFRLLNIHVNKHYRRQVCHMCGAVFASLRFLNLHKTRCHRPFYCKLCNLTFDNKRDKMKHDLTTHNIKIERKRRFPCPYCEERFHQESHRIQHLIESHEMIQPEYKCTICPKLFITKSLCNNHIKNVHNKEKKHECDVCQNLFYSKSDVLRHKVTHTGEKNYSCAVCNNTFATKASVSRHMKRVHNMPQC